MEKHIQQIRQHVIYSGNTDDIRIGLNNMLKNGSATADYLKAEIELEKSERNRATVIKMLEAAIRKLYENYQH